MSNDPYIDADGRLHDETAEAMVHAVERHNVRDMLVSTQLERVRYFEGRMAALKLSPTDYLIVVLNADDPNGGALAEILMPGHDWSEIRALGQIPYARGMVARQPMQESLVGEAARELAEIDGIAVLVMDRGIVTAFAASALQ
jgi:hypothetical protein